MVERPDLSVLVPVYGGWKWVRRALVALVANTDPIFEVVVVDNASPDGTGHRLREEVTGIRLVRAQRNLGFGVGTNLAALHARAPVLCLLNSDAMVEPGWLAPLLDALDRPGVGAAVPRFLGTDGRVQEAGSVVGEDGSTLALGRGEDPGSRAWRFPRVVDYASAACMVIRRSTFASLGGFHPVYGPAYCEDVDLCLELASIGLGTAYEPRSTVVHAGAASSDPVRAGARMRANRRILRRRWGGALSLRPPLDDLDRHPHRLAAARDVPATARILVLLSAGGTEREAGVALALTRMLPGARVTVVSAVPWDDAAAEHLLVAGVEVAEPGPDPTGWFRARRYHHEAVVAVGPAAAAAFAAAVAAYEPGAPRAYVRGLDDPAGPGVRTATELRSHEVGWVTTCAVVLCRSEGERAFLSELAPDAEVLGPRPGEAFPAEALAELGLTPAVVPA